VSARAITLTLSFPRSHSRSHSNSHTYLTHSHTVSSLNPLYPYQFTVMFDFEKLTVYKKAKIFNAGIRAFIKSTRLDHTTNDQLRRAAFSVVLNLAEGSGRFSKPDRRNFYIIARSSIFECIAILDVLKDEAMVEESMFNGFYNEGEELSKIIFTMIANLHQAK
jgi:four helix bundle protein